METKNKSRKVLKVLKALKTGIDSFCMIGYTVEGFHKSVDLCKNVGGKVYNTYLDPKPVIVKKQPTIGPFGKREVVLVNEFTNKVTPYTGSEKPMSRKPKYIVDKNNHIVKK